MKFWIVTPSYNQLDWLKLCVASVADQAMAGAGHEALGVGEEPIEVHHHVQDACSTDGTREFLAEHLANSPASGATDNSQQRIMTSGNGSQLEASAPNAQYPEPSAEPSSPNAQSQEPSAPFSGYTFSYASESDNGMYDAINRGWKLAPDDVDVIAHLNCDEQYLPNALQTIASFFKAHQKADVVFADMIVVNKDGEYICHRRALKPFSITSRYCCAGFTATTFQRASVTQEKGVFFDISWRNFGDKVWYNALHEAGCRFSVCNQLVAAFADTGANLNWTEEGLRERRLYEEKYLGGSRVGTLLVAKSLGLRRAIKELFIKPPASYAIFQLENDNRVTMPITNPKGLWNKKWKKS